MLNFILKFWPVLIPLLCFLIWRKIARKRGSDKLPEWEAKLWLVTLASTLFIAITLAILWVNSEERNVEGKYIPTQYKDGKLVPAHVEPENKHE